VQYVSGTFNASQGKDSGYVGTSNETEEMWNWVTVDMGDQMITPEELKLVNKPKTSVKVKDPKTGKEGYRIGLEVFHQLHCLNLIRKSTYRDHYQGKGDFEEDEDKIRAHLGMNARLTIPPLTSTQIIMPMLLNLVNCLPTPQIIVWRCYV